MLSFLAFGLELFKRHMFVSNIISHVFPFGKYTLPSFCSDVAKLISSVFNSQIFMHGFVHCDPHEANVLLREHPLKKGKPQIVLVDHGLYKTLDGEFQEAYARLWKAIVMADIPGIELACKSLGVQRMVSGMYRIAIFYVKSFQPCSEISCCFVLFCNI